MNSFSTNYSDKDISFTKHKNNSSTNIVNIKFIFHHERSLSFTKKFDKFKFDKIVQKIEKSKKIKINRKDAYGNQIMKGGKQRICFKDSENGKFLVEMSFIDVKQNCLKDKNDKNNIIYKKARDKEGLFSDGCILF